MVAVFSRRTPSVKAHKGQKNQLDVVPLLPYAGYLEVWQAEQHSDGSVTAPHRSQHPATCSPALYEIHAMTIRAAYFVSYPSALHEVPK